ncbi:PRC-barrel domain containing protein [Mesorhizobium sp. M7D.F.Ca.US.005.01.1.1]|uniref:PRC-barrel domain-containing protein n=1 Tax=unclassified Mesorhizobium TaxID=325217 RepID=UPI000F75065D|nr:MULTISPECIES: PRC-barrel domain-containing protein [unclassified Mesorhizobium]AZO45638.1 PRC-barrel domain containing protein [Mesorhizobium sp. M7D.F.Ca.US.005.01.1.1]RVA32828.1 PRC-barrel domain containing protein [Mesorhizobium sp. M7D.F.Ca.US.004.03.1.1]
MIGKLLATTAIATLLSSGLWVSGAAAEDATKPATATTTAATAPAAVADGSLVTKIIGADVYDSAADNAEKIGDVKDIVLSKDGKAKYIIIGVGGFLGLGEKNVAYDFSKAEWVEKKGERWLVAKTTKEDLQAQQDFDLKVYDTAAAPNTNDVAATTTNNEAAPATDKTATAAIDKSSLTEMPMDKISTKDFIGTNVYGADDAKVGEIGDVVMTGDKKVDAVIVDVGGFLGMGEKQVAIGLEKLKFMSDKDGNRYLYTNFTKAQLEAQTAYDKATYAQNRDKQRIIVGQ